MPIDSDLPPSLRVKPNIPLRDQTYDQLVAERDFWQFKITEHTSWGASLGAAQEFLEACNREISRRESKKTPQMPEQTVYVAMYQGSSNEGETSYLYGVFSSREAANVALLKADITEYEIYICVLDELITKLI